MASPAPVAHRASWLTIHNARAVPLADVPVNAVHAFHDSIAHATREERLAAFFGQRHSSGRSLRLYAVLADDSRGKLSVGATDVEGSFPSVTPLRPEAHWFERAIAEQFDVRPEGHPWLKPIRFSPRAHAGPSNGSPGVTDFFQVAGEEVHEVAVGPIHAGVIEPGHFRFQCHGEEVFHLEISLGYQHRGVEQALPGGPTKRTIHYMETLAGDTSVGHATAYCQAVEALAGVESPARAQALRGIALELERLANHTGDLGALANDVGFLPTAAFCGRLRGDFLNASAMICGSRFGRGLVRPGGVAFDVEPARVADLQGHLAKALRDVLGAARLLWETPSVMARFDGTGPVTRDTALALGLVGPAARACGLERDIRNDFPSGIYRFRLVPVSSWSTGDVFARAFVRALEIERSVEFLKEQLETLPGGATRTPVGDLPQGKLVVSLVEGWRGEICHVAITDEKGRFAGYKVVDPSFHNWMGLAMALRGQQISDFPLCNKSFNLSYCGHDL
jgi:Ni,Fe-hydrogenase III large subunit